MRVVIAPFWMSPATLFDGVEPATLALAVDHSLAVCQMLFREAIYRYQIFAGTTIERSVRLDDDRERSHLPETAKRWRLSRAH